MSDEDIPVLSAPDHPQLFYRKPFKASEYRPIPHRHFFVLSLHLAGKTLDEISELSGYQPSTICTILAKKEVIQVRQQLLRYTQDEFEALYSTVVQKVRELLDSKDEGIVARAIEIWCKAHGKFQGASQQINITAEDIVMQILNQPRDEEY